MTKQIAVCATDSVFNEKARELAKSLKLPLVDFAATKQNFSYLLLLDKQGLALHQLTSKPPKPFYIDFIHGKEGYRRKHGGGNGQSIAKAVGIKANYRPNILDITGGAGRDAFVLSSLGCQVSILERNPIIGTLLIDGLNRAQSTMTTNINCYIADANDFLPNLSIQQRPDVIYIDPMYPLNSKSAKVKQTMVYLRDIVGDDSDADKLLPLSLQYASKRVVVKRHRQAPFLGSEPNYSLSGKSTRFDIYLLDK